MMRAADRDHFFPGLKPRGHESVLYSTTRELVAALPSPAEAPAGEPEAGAGGDLFDAPNDREEARAHLRRNGHRRFR